MIRRPGTSIALKQSDVDDLARVLTERRRIARPPGADLADESRNAGVGIAAAQQQQHANASAASAANESSAVGMDQSSMQSDVDMLVEEDRRRRQEREAMTREQRIGV